MIPGVGACSLASVPTGGQTAGAPAGAGGAYGSPVLERLRERFARVAVVHDWLTIPGGSEQVMLELLEMFPQAELFTSIYDPAPWPAEITERTVHSSFLGRIPGATRHYPKLLPLMNTAFRSFDLSGFDLVLSSSHACAKNVRTPAGALHVCYCHTPMRYAWEEGFLDGEEVGRAMRLALPPLLAWLRRVDLAGAAGPDVFVANSRHVAERIERYYGRTAEIVHPPVDVEHYLALERQAGDPAPADGGAGGEGGGDPDGYYFAFGRVVPYKRVDLAVAACASLGRRLKVAGDGRALDAVRAQAPGAGVELLGKVSASERDRLFAGARALLFPGEEDFGIVPVEAQAAGLPVIAYGVGGAAETVIDGRTGVLFDEQSIECLAAAITRFESLALDGRELRENARRFGRERFREEMAGVIARAAGA
ncbi:MAG: glycosyltransferase [Solirubrobacteraceae bacterium]|jgi:glycosyltransferase involved in cell wall biosynthesis